MVKKVEEEQEEQEETPKKKKDKWEVRLVITNEDQPPNKVLVKGEESLDDWGYKAKVLNNQEELLKALLS